MAKSLNDTQIKLIAYLNTKTPSSGAYLADCLNVSRTSIWKQFKQLQSYGLPVESMGNKGYRLTAPFICLEESKIREQLQAHQSLKNIKFHIFSEINSTNQFLKTLPLDDRIHCSLSEKQTAGRGRFQREWFSPFGQNLYFSMRYKMPCDLSKLSGLSLMVSLSIVKTLKQFGIPQELKIKWPNDILWENKKLSGNLIEVMAETHAESYLIIGIGLNINMTELPEESKSINYCSLMQMTDQYQDRNRIAARLIQQLDTDLGDFFNYGFPFFKNSWMEYDYFQGKKLTVRQMDKIIEGTGHGISDKGELIVEDTNGKMHYLSSGDTSIGS